VTVSLKPVSQDSGGVASYSAKNGLDGSFYLVFFSIESKFCLLEERERSGECLGWQWRDRRELQEHWRRGWVGATVRMTRECWTYYTLETPPLFAVLSHGMAAVAFWRGVKWLEWGIGKVVRYRFTCESCCGTVTEDGGGDVLVRGEVVQVRDGNPQLFIKKIFKQKNKRPKA